MKKELKFTGKQGDLVTLLREHVKEQGEKESILLNADVYIDGKFLHSSKWESTTIFEDEEITIYPNIHYAISAGIVAYLAGTTVAAMTTAMVVAAYALSAVFSIVASFALNWAMQKLFPTDEPEGVNFDSGESLPTITGASNAYRPNEPLQQVIGTMRVTPDHAVKYYSVVSNGAQEIRHLFCVSAGDVDVWDIRKDDTPITSLYGIEYYIHNGWKGEPLHWFDDAVYPLTQDFSTKDYAVFKAQSPIGTKKVSMIITFAGGLYNMTLNDSNKSAHYIAVSIKCTNIETNEVINNVIEIVNPTPTSNTYREGVSVDLSVGVWDLEVYTYSTVTGGGVTSQVPCNNKTFFENQYVVMENSITELQWIKEEPAITYTGQAMTLIELKATASDKLSGGLNTVNCMARLKGKKADGTLVESSNPALLARRLLTDSDIIQNSDYVRINDESFANFEAHCDKYGFTANGVEQSGTNLGKVLADMFEPAQGYITGASGEYVIFYDDPMQASVDTITSRNSWGMTITSSRPIKPVDGIRVAFYNADMDYQNDERIVSENGVTPQNTQALSNKFITNADFAYKYGMLALAMQKLRNSQFTFNTDWRSIDYKLGQKILITHPSHFLGIGTEGKVIDFVKNEAGGYEAVILDQRYNTDLGKEYILQSSEKYGESKYYDIKAVDNEETATLYFTTPIYIESLLPSIGAFFVFGETSKIGQYVQIRNITRNKDFSAEIECIMSDERYYDALTGVIPPFESNLSFPTIWGGTKPSTPQIVGITVIKETAQKDTSGRIHASANIALSYLEKAGVDFSYYSIGVKEKGANEFVYYTSDDKYNFVIPSVYQAQEYEIKIASVSTLGFYSTENEMSYIPTELMESLPQVQGFGTIYNDKGVQELIWSAVNDWRPFEYEVRHSVSSVGFYQSNTYGVFDVPNNPPISQTGFYHIIAKSGLATSAVISSIEIEDILGEGIVKNVIATIDEKADGWDNIDTQEFRKDPNSDNIYLDKSTGDFWAVEDFWAITDFWSFDYTGETGYYEHKESKDILLSANNSVNIDFTFNYYGDNRHEDFWAIQDFWATDNFWGIMDSNVVCERQVQARKSGLWGEWQTYLDVNSYYGDGFRFRIKASSDVDTILYISDFKVSVDVPDNLQKFVNIDIPIEGYELVFNPPYNQIPNIQGTLVQPTGNEDFYHEYADVTRTNATIYVRDKQGNNIQWNANVLVQGY